MQCNYPRHGHCSCLVGALVNELYEALRAITLYDALAVSVRGHGGQIRAAAAVSLVELVGEQVCFAQEQGVFTPPRVTNKIPVLVCADATPLWRAAATRCDVFIGVWPGGLASAGNPDNWVTWCVVDESDHRGCVRAMEAGLNAQIEHWQSNCNVPSDGTVLGYVGMTGSGKGMQVTNHSPDGNCWSCDDHDSLEPVDGLKNK